MASKDRRLALMGEVLRHVMLVKALGWEGLLQQRVRPACGAGWCRLFAALRVLSRSGQQRATEASLARGMGWAVHANASLHAPACARARAIAHALCAVQVAAYRHRELRALATRKYLDALCVYFWATTQLLLSGTTFGLMVLLGQPLRYVGRSVLYFFYCRLECRRCCTRRVATRPPYSRACMHAHLPACARQAVCCVHLPGALQRADRAAQRIPLGHQRRC